MKTSLMPTSWLRSGSRSESWTGSPRRGNAVACESAIRLSFSSALPAGDRMFAGATSRPRFECRRRAPCAAFSTTSADRSEQPIVIMRVVRRIESFLAAYLSGLCGILVASTVQRHATHESQATICCPDDSALCRGGGSGVVFRARWPKESSSSGRCATPRSRSCMTRAVRCSRILREVALSRQLASSQYLFVNGRAIPTAPNSRGAPSPRWRASG